MATGPATGFRSLAPRAGAAADRAAGAVAVVDQASAESAPGLRFDLTAFLLVAPAVLYLLLVFVLPVLNIFWMSLTQPTLGLASYEAFFTAPHYVRALVRTFSVAFAVTLGCLLLGYPLAYAMARAGGRLALALVAVIVTSLWTSNLVRAYAWLIILGNKGPVVRIMQWLQIDSQPQILFNVFSMFIGMVHVLTPYMVLTIYAVMRGIDADLLRASASLGASPARQFTTVYLPLSLPGVVNGCTLVFILALGFYVTPVLLGGPRDVMLPALIGAQMNQLLEWGMAGAMTSVLIVSTLLSLAVYQRFVGLRRLWG